MSCFFCKNHDKWFLFLSLMGGYDILLHHCNKKVFLMLSNLIFRVLKILLLLFLVPFPCDVISK